MRDDRFRPCEISEAADVISWINEPTVDIPPRRQLPLHAVMNDVRSHTEVLAARLEAGVRARSDEQRDVIRRLYLQTKRQLEALSACLDLEDL
jgi:hypothetical protein